MKNEPLPYFLSQQDQKMQNKWLGKGKPIHFKISGHFLNSDMHLLYENQLDWMIGSFFVNRDGFYKEIEKNILRPNIFGAYLMNLYSMCIINKWMSLQSIKSVGVS